MERLARKEDVPAAMRRVPAGRYGTVKEIADATVWLFSDAGNFVNGAVVVGELVRFSFFSGVCGGFVGSGGSGGLGDGDWGLELTSVWVGS